MFDKFKIDPRSLIIIEVEFSDMKTLENKAYAIEKNMFEYFKPTSSGKEILRDLVIKKTLTVRL